MINATVHKPMYEVGTRRYMDIEITGDFLEIIKRTQNTSNFEGGFNPLRDTILSVKVPFRYKRVDCKVLGLTPVQALQNGDKIAVCLQFCGSWKDTGMFWKFDLIQKIDPPGCID